MRTQLELWEIVNKNFDNFFFGGLCSVIYDLYRIEIITERERELLLSDVRVYDNGIDLYFLGDVCEPAPRKEFIKKMLEKHSK